MSFEQIKNISCATKKNWDRLIPDVSGKLQHGANKRLSSKRIIPKEYICNNSIDFVNKIISIYEYKHLNIQDTIYSLAYNLLHANGIWEKENVVKVMKEYSCFWMKTLYN